MNERMRTEATFIAGGTFSLVFATVECERVKRVEVEEEEELLKRWGMTDD